MADKKRLEQNLAPLDNPNTPENEAWVKTTSKSSNKKALPPKGSAEYKAMLLRGEIKE